MTNHKRSEGTGPHAIGDLLKKTGLKAPAAADTLSTEKRAVVPTGDSKSLQLIPGHLEANRARRKLLASSEIIFGTPADSKDAAFIAREIVQASLPHSDPGDIPAWVRENGNVTLSIQPGFNHDTRHSYGYPYGTIPRLLLFWITTEAVRQQSRRIQLGHSLNDFVRTLGLNPDTGGGARGDAARVEDQMQRLFAANFRLSRVDEVGDSSGQGFHQMQIARRGYFWWSHNEPEQGSLWDSWIELSDEFYEAITQSPVPVDLRALRALKRSPLALDLYAWLTYEAFRSAQSGKARFESWAQLHAHMGGNYTVMQNFAYKVRGALKKIQLVYPGLKLGWRTGGLEILPSSVTAIQPREPLAHRKTTSRLITVR
jgi:hypothetical protein